MKKILLLISILFLLTGCYDYKELNKLAFVSAIGIDYQNDEYVISLEISNIKGSKESKEQTSYTVTSSDTTLAKAIENARNKVSTQVNYTHTKLLVLSKSMISSKLETIVDFFLRSTYFRENFYVVSSMDNNPEDILKLTSEENPIASTAIMELLESNKYASNSSIMKTFDTVIKETITFGTDTCFSNINITDKTFIIDGAVIFKDYDFASKISNEEATLYNVLIKNFYRPIFSKEYDSKYFSIAMATGEPKIEIKNNIINISGTLTGKIMNNEPNFDIKSIEELKKINKDFSVLLSEKISNFLQNLQQSESDILGITRSYYQKTREKNEAYWHNLKINSNIDFKINKKGLIYEVEDEK